MVYIGECVCVFIKNCSCALKNEQSLAWVDENKNSNIKIELCSPHIEMEIILTNTSNWMKFVFIEIHSLILWWIY